MKKGVALLFSIIITPKQNLVFLSAPLQLSRDLQLHFKSCKKKKFKPLAASWPSSDILLSRYWCFQTSSALFHLLLWWGWRGNGFAHFLTVFSFTICGTFSCTICGTFCSSLLAHTFLSYQIKNISQSRLLHSPCLFLFGEPFVIRALIFCSWYLLFHALSKVLGGHSSGPYNILQIIILYPSKSLFSTFVLH